MSKSELLMSRPDPQGPGAIEKIIRTVITLSVVLSAFGIALFLG